MVFRLVLGLHPPADSRMAPDATGRGRHPRHLPAPCHAAGPRAAAAGAPERLPRGAQQRPERALGAAPAGGCQPGHLGLSGLQPRRRGGAGGRLGRGPARGALRAAAARPAGPVAVGAVGDRP